MSNVDNDIKCGIELILLIVLWLCFHVLMVLAYQMGQIYSLPSNTHLVVIQQWLIVTIILFFALTVLVVGIYEDLIPY